MNKIQEVKARIDIIKVAQYLGIPLQRGNKCCCIWHNEKSASLFFSQSKQIFKCFGCGVSGDAIELYSKINNLNAYESARALNDIFGCGIIFYNKSNVQNINKTQVNKFFQIQKGKERFEKWRNDTLKMLCDYLHSLNWVERDQKGSILEYYIDMLIYGTKEDWLWFEKNEKGWCEEIERTRNRNFEKQSTL